MIHVGQVIEHVESQVNVHLVETSSCFTEITNLAFFSSGVLGFSQGLCLVLLYLGDGTFLKQAVNLLLHLLEVLFFTLVLLLLNRSIGSTDLTGKAFRDRL